MQKYRVRVHYTTKDGQHKEINRIAYGLEQAKELEYKLEKEVKEKMLVYSKVTMQELFDEYIAVKQQEVRESSWDKTTRILKRYVLSKLSKCVLCKLGVKEFQQWKLEIGNLGLSLITRQNIYGELRAMLNYAVKMEYIPINPLLKVGNFKNTITIQKEMDFYTPEEFKLFIKAAKESALLYEQQHNNLYEWNYYVFFNIAYYTGCRKGEIHGLCWNDISDNLLSIKRSVNQKLRKNEDVETAPKNRSSIRTVQIPVPLIQILNEHKERQMLLPDFNEECKILGNGRCLRDSSLHNKNTQYAKAAGIKRIRINDFRHSHASLLANMGINIQQIAKRLGHSDIKETLNTYSHLYPREEEKAMQVLNAI